MRVATPGLADAQPAIDFVYRWCHPDRASGDGDIRRRRDNGELRFSLRSLRMHVPWLRQIHIVFAGSPPELEDRTGITLIDERLLFVRANERHGVKIDSGNSEPVKLCFPLIDNLAPYFVSMDDDFFITRDLRVEWFLDAGGRPRYPREIRHSHRPLIFRTTDYAQYVDGMSGDDHWHFLRSGNARHDIYETLIPALCERGLATWTREWATVRLARTYGTPTALAITLGWKKDLRGLSLFVRRRRGRYPLFRVERLLRHVYEHRPYTICVNDDWDRDDPVRYNAEMAVLHECLGRLFPKAG